MNLLKRVAMVGGRHNYRAFDITAMLLHDCGDSTFVITKLLREALADFEDRDDHHVSTSCRSNDRAAEPRREAASAPAASWAACRHPT
jgi:hypothetical protein